MRHERPRPLGRCRPGNRPVRHRGGRPVLADTTLMTRSPDVCTQRPPMNRWLGFMVNSPLGMAVGPRHSVVFDTWMTSGHEGAQRGTRAAAGHDFPTPWPGASNLRAGHICDAPCGWYRPCEERFHDSRLHECDILPIWGKPSPDG